MSGIKGPRSQTTSTPIKIKHEVPGREEGLKSEKSPSLRSLLGVSPVVNSGSVGKTSSRKESGQQVDQEAAAAGARARRASASGILRGANTGHSSLSLQQVIQRISGDSGGRQQQAGRARSFSLSELGVAGVGGGRAGSLDLGQTRAFSVKREGTPESDAGYGTGASPQESSSPETDLAQLVHAMKVGAEVGGGDDVYCPTLPLRPKLPSISELDPAVSHAVKSYSPGRLYQGHSQSLNLLDTLLYSAPAQQAGQVGAASLLSDRHQINSLFATHPSDPASLERAAKLYRNAASLYDATCTWSGQLPPRHHQNPLYSSK